MNEADDLLAEARRDPQAFRTKCIDALQAADMAGIADIVRRGDKWALAVAIQGTTDHEPTANALAHLRAFAALLGVTEAK